MLLTDVSRDKVLKLNPKGKILKELSPYEIGKIFVFLSLGTLVCVFFIYLPFCIILKCLDTIIVNMIVKAVIIIAVGFVGAVVCVLIDYYLPDDKCWWKDSVTGHILRFSKY